MTTRHSLQKLGLFLSLSPLFSSLVLAQNPQRPEPKDDVVRVYTELVQTDVMVFDKNGKFVDDLRREDFELRIDGKPRPIEFFERVKAGTATEESQLAAARGSANAAPSGIAVPLDRGRTVFFYLDDLHLDLSGTQLARKVVTQYIEREMGQNDEAAITSSSGQIGFLQQLTDNKTVLRRALERLRPRSTSVLDGFRPPMSEYQALLITRYHRDVMDYFIEAILRENPGLSRETAEQLVLERAQQLMLQGGNITRASLAGLETLIKSSTGLPGRKLVFFISSGFLLDERNSDSLDRLRRITDSAARNGVVVYTMDARGLVATLTPASVDVPFDVSGRLASASLGELHATQDVLSGLASDTGGKAILDTNSLEPGLKRALFETSAYYLLAWKPDTDASASERFRKIEIKVINRNNLTVRTRRGFIENATVASNKKSTNAKLSAPESALVSALNSPFPDRSLPVALALTHLNLQDKGNLLSVALQVPEEFLTFTAGADNKRQTQVEVTGSVYNDRGQAGATFRERLSVSAPMQSGDGDKKVNLAYSYPLFLNPGLYEARVAVVDVATARAGSAHAWIEIPDLSSRQLAMSSVLVGERAGSDISNASTGATDDSKQVNISVDKRFHRGSFLRLLVYIYNSSLAPQSGKPDIAIQIQVIRDDQPVVTTALRKVDPEGVSDLTRLPYAAEVRLDDLRAGQYLLVVTALDRVSKRSTSQQTKFQIVD